MDELEFWKSCCQRGIMICKVPKPFKEELPCWLVTKFATFADRNTWVAGHTFDSAEEMAAEVRRYLESGVEPRSHHSDQ